MIFSKLKISAKLLISSAVFLIPIGVMLLFICSMTIRMVQKNMDEHLGINTLGPAVTAMQNLPEYFNIYLGLERGNSRQLDEQISNAVRTLDREMGRYRAQGLQLPNFSAEWETLKRIRDDDVTIYQKYLDFAHSLRDLIHLVGEHSRLILVSDMNTYYFVSSTLSSIPEASIRLMATSNHVRRNLYEADAVVQRWNAELAESHALGRRLPMRQFDMNPRDMMLFMIAPEDLLYIRNNGPLFESDRQRIGSAIRELITGIQGNAGEFEELSRKLRQYEESADILPEMYARMSPFGVTNQLTAVEFLENLSQLNSDLCQLWSEAFSLLDSQIQQKISTARRQLGLYLTMVIVSLGLAVGFVWFIKTDINRSVKSLKTMLNGLNKNDLTLSLQTKSRDELGELMIAFNGFLNILRSTFGSFKQNAQLVANSVFDISSASKEITTTANEQSASVSEIVSTMEGSKNLSEQISLKTIEVANLAKETQELSNKGADISEENQHMMEDVLKQNQKTISEIRNLSDMIVRISEAIRIIDSIADQTKLIAFNASLEASSSGEAGARFSVVASEIRRFADNVVESTKEIKQKIEEVQDASQILIAAANSGSRQIEIGYERMSEQKKEFAQIVDNSQNVATRSQQISNLSKQQEIASTQIFTALKEISAGVKQFVIATSSTSKIADSLNDMSVELREKVEKYRTES